MAEQIIKYCETCGTKISNLYEEGTDVMRHIALRYCPDCRKLSDKQKAAIRFDNWKKRKKQKEAYRDKELELLKERIAILEKENDILRNRMISEREKNER